MTTRTGNKMDQPILVEGSDHELVEYYLTLQKVVNSGGGSYYTLWFEDFPLEEGDVVEERWVAY
jgi:hypothetical protein